MRMVTWRETAKKYLPPIAVIICIIVFLLSCKARVQTVFPEVTPVDGVLDIRQTDFSREVYHLVNSWEHHPGVLYTPADFSAGSAREDPNEADSLDERKGTWRLRILAQPNAYLCLCSFSIDFCTRIYVNGEEVRSVGFVSDDPDEAVPLVRYVTLPIFTGENGTVEIIYQHANYWHKDGGFIQSTLISTPENIDEYQRGLTLYSLLLSGGLLFLMFYFLLSAAIQTRREYTALALCALVMALRNQFFFAEHLLPSGYDFYLEYRVVVLDVSLIPACALRLLAAFYPKAMRRWVLTAFSIVILLLSVLHFVVNIIDLVALCHVCYYVCGGFFAGFLLCLIRWFWREHRPDWTDGITLAALGFLTYNLIWEGVNSGSNSSVNHFGITPLAMTVAILLLAVVLNSRISRQTLQLHYAEEKNEMLSHVNEMNKDFLRMVAHELKTPLTVISGYAQLIGMQTERGSGPEQTVERLKTIRSEADRLGEIVNQLMAYTYGGSADSRMDAVDTDELLQAVSAVMTPVCAKRQNTIRLEADFHGKLHGNLELLLQVLINLIVNASKHSSQSEILVRTEEAGSFAAFSVKDHGTGISPEAVPHIFEKGYTTTDGKGLGLAICKQTIALHGGTLDLVSTSPEGSCFRFTVPKENEK